MTHTPRNEFERLSDQDPALGQEQDFEASQNSLIANLKARLPEASLGEDFPKVQRPAENETNHVLASNSEPSTDTGASSAKQTSSTERAASSAPATDPLPTVESSPHATTTSQEAAKVVPLNGRKRLAWGQIAASVAITALVAGGAATAVASPDGIHALTNLVAGQSVSDGSAPDMTATAESLDSASMSSGSELDGGLGDSSEGMLGGGSPVESGRGSGSDAGESVSTTPQQAGAATSDTATSDTASESSKFSETSRNHYEGKGLPTDSEVANAFGFDETDAVKKSTFKKLMKVFGIDGKITTGWGSFYIQKDGADSLNLSGGGTGSFYYSVADQPFKQSKLNVDKSLADAKDKMTALGVNLDDYEISAEKTEYWSWIDDAVARDYNEGKAASDKITAGEKKLKVVRVTATLKTLRADEWTGRWSFDYMGGDLLSAEGSLAQQVDLGEYKVVSAAAGVDRLNDERFGVTNSIYPEGWEDQFYANSTAPDDNYKDEGPTANPVPKTGRSFAWEVANVTLAKATLTRAVFYEKGGVFLLPVWEYTATNGAKYQVLAVEDSNLDFTP